MEYFLTLNFFRYDKCTAPLNLTNFTFITENSCSLISLVDSRKRFSRQLYWIGARGYDLYKEQVKLPFQIIWSSYKLNTTTTKSTDITSCIFNRFRMATKLPIILTIQTRKLRKQSDSYANHLIYRQVAQFNLKMFRLPSTFIWIECVNKRGTGFQLDQYRRWASSNWTMLINVDFNESRSVTTQ